MRPYPEEIVRALQSGVMAHFAPELTSTYAQAQFGFSMLLFGLATRDADHAVPDLIDANSALREMLEKADAALAGAGGDAARAGRDAIAGLAPPADSLLLSALRTENDALRAAFGALAPLIEPAADDASLAALRPLRRKLYAWLLADAKKRMVPILSG